MQRRDFLVGLGAAGVLGLGLNLTGCGRRADAKAGAASGPETEKPKIIRIGAAGSWGSVVASGFMGILQSQRLLEQEFEKDGVKIEWHVIDGNGPAQNEAISNGLIDFGHYGALPNIIGKARGLKTRILASYGYGNNYLAVRSALPARSPADLKGLTLAADIGHIGHLVLAMLLKQFNVRLDEIKLVKMGPTDAVAALAAGRIDAFFGGATLFPLEQQGLVRIIYTAKDRATRANNFGGFLVVENFADRYPDSTRRVLKSYLRAVHWIAQPENREAYFKWVADHSTTPLDAVRRDFENQELRDRVNPVIDDYYLSRYRDAVAFCRENGLIRRDVDVDRWIDRDTNRAVLAELGWNAVWPVRDATGKTVGA